MISTKQILFAVALGGDVPPELDGAAGVDVGTAGLEAGHEWTPAFSAEARRFLKRQTR